MKIIKISMIAFISMFQIVFAYGQTKQNDSLTTNSGSKIKELGIGFTNFTSYSLQYRWGNEKRLFRVTGTVSFTHGNQSSNFTDDTSNVFFSSSDTKVPKIIQSDNRLIFSILKNISLDEKVGIMYGPSIGINYSYSNTTSNNSSTLTTVAKTTNTISTQSITPNLGLILSFYYKLRSNVYLYAEINPQIFYTYSLEKYDNETLYIKNIQKHQTNKNHYYGIRSLSNSNLMFSLVYRLKK